MSLSGLEVAEQVLSLSLSLSLFFFSLSLSVPLLSPSYSLFSLSPFNVLGASAYLIICTFMQFSFLAQAFLF